MKLQLWAIGKPNEPYVAPGVEDFSRRLRNYFPTTWKILPPPRNASSHAEADLKKKEAELILSGLGKEDWLVALDEHGKLIN